MATLLYALTAAGAGMYYMYGSDRKYKLDNPVVAEDPMPFQGVFSHVSQVAGSQEHLNGRFEKATPIIDHRGVKAWLVDYGNFSQTIVYSDPTQQRA